MLSAVSLDECIQIAHCSNNSQSVYISTKPSLVCSSNHNSTFRHFINTADLFLIKEFHSTELWSLNISNLKTSLVQHAKRLFSIYFILRMRNISPKNATLPADDAWREWQRWPSLQLCKKAVPVTQENMHRHCFQDRSRSASASLRNSLSFKQSTAEINSLPRKVERLCFSAVGFIFMTVNHTVIFTIPALQSNKCNNLWPRLLAKQEWFKLKDWDTGKEERSASFTRFDQYAIYTWKENWGKLDLVGTVGSRACLQLRSQQKDCMATRLLVPAWVSNHSVIFNLKTSERKRWTSINHCLVITSWTVHGKQRCWVRVSELLWKPQDFPLAFLLQLDISRMVNEAYMKGGSLTLGVNFQMSHINWGTHPLQESQRVTEPSPHF